MYLRKQERIDTMTKWKWIVPSVIAIVCGAAVIFYLNYYRRASIVNFSDCVAAGYPISSTYPLQCEADGRVFVKQNSDPVQEAVRNVVMNFGQAMQLVSTNAPKTLAAQAILNDYHNLVAPPLLAKWMNDPASAPGRPVSSPWPDHVAITAVQETSPMDYSVRGNVVLMTNTGVAGTYAVTTTVTVVDGNWMISSWDASAG